MTPKEKQKQHLIDMMQEDEKLGLYDLDKRSYLLGYADAKEKLFTEEQMREAFILGMQQKSKLSPASEFEKLIKK